MTWARATSRTSTQLPPLRVGLREHQPGERDQMKERKEDLRARKVRLFLAALGNIVEVGNGGVERLGLVDLVKDRSADET